MVKKKVTLRDIKKKSKKKKERNDSKSNTLKVAKVAMKEPLLSQKQIAKKAWVSVWTVNAKLNCLESDLSTSQIIDQICQTDMEIVSLWQGIILERLQDEEELKKISARDVSTIIRENTARYTLFKWKATDDEWWLNAPILELDTDKLLQRLQDINEQKKKDNALNWETV